MSIDQLPAAIGSDREPPEDDPPFNRVYKKLDETPKLHPYQHLDFPFEFNGLQWDVSMIIHLNDIDPDNKAISLFVDRETLFLLLGCDVDQIDDYDRATINDQERSISWPQYAISYRSDERIEFHGYRYNSTGTRRNEGAKELLIDQQAEFLSEFFEALSEFDEPLEHGFAEAA